MIIALSGFAGCGKDTVADFLVKNELAGKVALADPLKRIARDVYAFSDEQLWGPSEKRNEQDERYPREHTFRYKGQLEMRLSPTCLCCGIQMGDETITKQCYLTPRYALQLLGSEWGRHCFEGTWASMAVRTAKRLLEGGCYYDAKRGLQTTSLVNGPNIGARTDVVIPDVRFKNEIRIIRDAGGKVVRVRRAGYDKPAFEHPSETEQVTVSDEEFDYVLENSASLEQLERLTQQMVDVLSGRIIPYDPNQADIPPFLRK